MIINKKKKREESVDIQEKENSSTVEIEENSDIESREEHSNTENKHSDKENTDKELDLFILCDNATNKFKEYIQETEIGAATVYSDIDKARDELMLEFDAYRLVIVDTGTGKFSGIAQRIDIVDILGMMDDGCTASIFYTDEALRADIKQHIGKNTNKIGMTRYNGTADMILEITRLGEKYTGKYKAEHEEVKEHNIIVRKSKANDRFLYGSKLIEHKEIASSIHDGEEIKSFNDYL